MKLTLALPPRFADFDSWSVRCPTCRAPAGYPCGLAWWNRRREHAPRFAHAWREYRRQLDQHARERTSR